MTLFSPVQGNPPGGNGGNGGVSLNGVPPPNEDTGSAGSAGTAQRSDHRHECLVRPVVHTDYNGWQIPGWHIENVVTFNWSAGYLIYTPIYVHRSRSYVVIGVSINIAGAPGSLIRLGIYEWDPATNIPGALRLDAGTVDSDSGGMKSITIFHAMEPGYYFLAGIGNSLPQMWSPNVANSVSAPVTSQTSAGGLGTPHQTLLYTALRSADAAAGLADPAPGISSLLQTRQAYVFLR